MTPEEFELLPSIRKTEVDDCILLLKENSEESSNNDKIEAILKISKCCFLIIK